MRVSGFSIIRDGVRFGYPFIESIRSLLPLVDEFVIAVGDSQDNTREILEHIESPKLRLLHTTWNESLRRGGQVMAQQTNLALDHCHGDWCFYLQGDEVLHERDYSRIHESMRTHLHDRRVEGLSFRYHHFYGSYGLVNPLAYRRQVRIIRGGTGIRSVGDACGFESTTGKLRTRSTGAWVYHYGWAREPFVMRKKHNKFLSFYSEGLRHCPHFEATEDAQPYHYDTTTCVPFEGTHPEVMHERIAAQNWPEPEYEYVPTWRNLPRWEGFLQKNFATIYRRLPRGKHLTSGKSHREKTSRAA